MLVTRRSTPKPAPSSSLWRNGAFRVLWIGRTASHFGDQVTGLALPWLVLLQTHSALAAGAVASLRYAPLVVLGLAAGLVADRVNRRTLMILADIVRGLALAVVAMFGVFRLAPPLWLLALVVLALGTGQVFFSVAYQALLPDVTGNERLGSAHAALEASDAASVLLGFPLAGALIAGIGPVLALGADACSYALSVLTLGCVRVHHPTQRPPAPLGARDGRLRRTWEEALEGVRLIVRMPAQRLLKGAGAPIYLDAGAIEVLLATLTQIRLHLPAWQAGLVFGAMGAGGLLGSAIGPRVYASGWRRGLAGTLAVAALGSLGLAWACVLGSPRGFAVALVAALLLDGATALGFILTLTANALVTPRELRGRVNAASTIYSSALRGLAALGGGALAASGNPLPAFALLAGCLLCGALVAARTRVEVTYPV